MEGLSLENPSMASLVPYAAAVFAALSIIAALFQFAVALGAPLGHLTLGARWPGRLPVAARIGAVGQGVLLIAMARIVAGAGGLLPLVGPTWLIWLVVAVSLLSAQLNLITPSPSERRLWAPVTTVMAIAVLAVAIWG